MFVHLSVSLSCMPCPLCNIYSWEWILSIFGTKTTSMIGCITHNDPWLWPISSGPFSHNFAIKLLKYYTSCNVHSTACTALDGLFPYLALMITSMRGWVDRSKVKVTQVFRFFARERVIQVDHRSTISSFHYKHHSTVLWNSTKKHW